MTNPPHQGETTDASQAWPRTIWEAIGLLARELDPAEKDKIASLPEADLIDLHFGLGARIREEFGLWEGNDALMRECQKARAEGGCPGQPEGMPGDIDPDDASMLIIRALWLRLRH